MRFFFSNSLHKMVTTYQYNVGDKSRSLFHHGLIKILVSSRLKELGQTWDSFLVRNGFGVNEEWPKQRPTVRRRQVNNEEAELEVEDSGSQDDLGDEGFHPDQTLSLDDMKIEVETSFETPANNFQGQGRKPSTPITCQDKSYSHTQVNKKKTKVEHQTSSARSKLAI